MEMVAGESRVVLHVRVAAFPAAVERAADPALRGRPLAIAPRLAERARLIAVTSEARREGVRPGMELGQARRACMGLIVRPLDPELCAKAGEVLLSLARRYSPLVEPAGGGAAFLDLTGTGRLFGAPQDVARSIGRALADYRLPAGLGVASNKLVSRVAARAQRPARPCAVRAGEEERFLAPFPVAVLPGVEGRLRGELADLNIRWVRELARIALLHLKLIFGRMGELLQRRARGIDSAPVWTPEQEPVIRLRELLPEDTNDFEQLRAAASRLASRAAAEARAAAAFPGRFELGVTYADGKLEELRRLLPLDAAHEMVLRAALLAALPRAIARRVRIKSLALELGDLDTGVRQLDLFAPPRRQQTPRRLDAALDLLKRKYGRHAIHLGARGLDRGRCRRSENVGAGLELARAASDIVLLRQQSESRFSGGDKPLPYSSCTSTGQMAADPPPG